MASPLKYEDYLSNIYYDPKNAGAYGGVEKLYRAVKKDGKFVLGRSKIRNWLLKQEDYPFIERHVQNSNGDALWLLL